MSAAAPIAPALEPWVERTIELSWLLTAWGPDLGYQARLLVAASSPGHVLLALPEIGVGLRAIAWALDDIARDPRLPAEIGDTLGRRFFDVQRAQAVALAVTRLCAEADAVARRA